MSEEKAYRIGETMSVSFTVLGVEYSKGTGVLRPLDGQEFVIVNLLIENHSNKDISYSIFDWSLLNSKGQKRNVTFTTIDDDTTLGSGILLPGGSITGTVVFEEPEDETSLTLLYYHCVFSEQPDLAFILK